MYVSRVCALRYARVFLFNIRPSERFNVSDGFEVLIKKNQPKLDKTRACLRAHTLHAGYACYGAHPILAFLVNNLVVIVEVIFLKIYIVHK